jgi:uncharacterized membrane protein (UPF0127 family)
MLRRTFSLRSGTGTVVCGRCVLADTFHSRLRGLLGRKRLGADEGLLLTPSGGIHTWFMRFPIDVAFLAPDLTVLGIRAAVKPWRMIAWRGAGAVLELPAGTCERRKLRVGDRLALEDYAESHANVLLVLRGDGDAQVVLGRGPLSAATRTVSAISELDVGVSAVLLHDEQNPAN